MSEAAGDVLSGEVLDDLHRPVGGVQVLDSTYCSGVTGFYLFSNTGDGAADATFDNFLAGEVPEPSTWTLLAFGGAALFYAILRQRKDRLAR